MDERLIAFGGAAKALGAGRVEGYLVLWGDAEQTDVSDYRDFFTAETDFGIAAGAKTAVWYRHALEPELDRQIGEGTLKADDVGVFVSAQLNMRDRYVKAVYEELATKGALGWSSGSALHLVRREKQANGAHKITRWPLGLDASLTPDPAEPRTQVVALKSLSVEPTLGALKALGTAGEPLLGEAIGAEMTMAALRTLNDRLFYSVVGQCLYDYRALAEGAEATPLADRLATLRAAFDEFRDQALRVVEAILKDDPAAESAGEAMKALKSLWQPGPAPARRSLAERTELVLEDLSDLLAGYRQVAGAEMKVGRKLSQARRERLESARQLIEDILAETTEREATDAEAVTGMVTEETTETKALNLDALRLKAKTLLVLAGHH